VGGLRDGVSHENRAAKDGIRAFTKEFEGIDVLFSALPAVYTVFIPFSLLLCVFAK
jgi:hypothetical protein